MEHEKQPAGVLGKCATLVVFALCLGLAWYLTEISVPVPLQVLFQHLELGGGSLATLLPTCALLVLPLAITRGLRTLFRADGG